MTMKKHTVPMSREEAFSRMSLFERAFVALIERESEAPCSFSRIVKGGGKEERTKKGTSETENSENPHHH